MFNAYIELHANDQIIAQDDARANSAYGARIAAFDKIREMVKALPDNTQVYVYVDVETPAGTYVCHDDIFGRVRGGELEVEY